MLSVSFRARVSPAEQDPTTKPQCCTCPEISEMKKRKEKKKKVCLLGPEFNPQKYLQQESVLHVPRNLRNEEKKRKEKKVCLLGPEFNPQKYLQQESVLHVPRNPRNPTMCFLRLLGPESDLQSRSHHQISVLHVPRNLRQNASVSSVSFRARA